MLSEVDTRPAEELAKFDDVGIAFNVPTGIGFTSKGEHLQALLGSGEKIICTHALFQGIGKLGRQLIQANEYIIIIDEELGMIEPLREDILKGDDRKELLKAGFITKEGDGKIIWSTETWGTGNSAFAAARTMAENGSLYSTRDGTFFNVQVPVEVISAAKRVIVATYLFRGSIFEAFLKIKGIGSKKFTFPGMMLRDEESLKMALRERVEMFGNIRSTDKFLHSLGVPTEDLKAKKRSSVFSSSWYKMVSGQNLCKVGKHIRNIARQMDVNPQELLYTLPSTIAGKNGNKWIRNGAKVVKVKGYSPENCFLHKGARATNNYSHKIAAIHLYNRYPHPAVKKYLEEQGALVDQDSFALAELIQWFFRTAIRVPNGPKVKFHIASPRMDYLFKEWLNNDNNKNMV